MNAEQFARVEALFEQACALPADQRLAFLDKACADDATIRAKVARMLERDSQSAAIDAPAMGRGFHVRDADELERRLIEEFESDGRYRLIEPLGEGGFGTVYRAEQLRPIRRSVAIKVIKAGMDTRRVMTRFEAERQTLALMNHPCIARVYDAGATPSGRPFFVMELVEGRPITRWCDEQRLDLAGRIALMLRVCDGVQHAHQKGIIHRDLKPSNILVTTEDGRAAPRIIDFGIARAVEQRGCSAPAVTEAGQPIGTLEYMSPEQASGGGLDIDTRTDIYSLGVVLYELITGTTPLGRDALRGASPGELLRILTSEDPPKPSTRLRDLATDSGAAQQVTWTTAPPVAIVRQLRGDLDWIVMKALEKDRSRRYESAAALADDIRRHLANEPVIARPPTAGYRFGRFARRHRLPLAIGTGIFATLIGAVVFTGIALVRIAAAEAEAQVERRIAETVNAFLNDELLAAVDPQASGIDVKVREVLDIAAERIEGRFEDAPRVEAALRTTIGRSYLGLGLYDDADRHLQRAHALLIEQLGRDSRSAIEVQAEIANLRLAQGMMEESIATLQDAGERISRTLGADHLLALRCEVLLGSAESHLGRRTDAARRLERVTQITQTKLGPNHSVTLSAMHTLAAVYRHSDPAAAEALYKRTIETLTQTYGAEHAFVVTVQNDLALLLEGEGRLDEALPIFEHVAAVKTRIFGDHHPETLDSANGLANVLYVLGRYAEAEAIFVRTLAGLRTSLGDGHPKTIICANSLARVYMRQERYAEAEPLCAEALARMRARFGELDQRTATTMSSLAQIYERQERYDDAEPLFRRVVEIGDALFGEDEASSLIARNNLAQLYRLKGRLDLAEPILQRVVATARKTLPPNHWQFGACVLSYGIVLRDLQRHADSEPLLLEGHGILKAALGDGHTRTQNAAKSLLKLYEAWGKPDEAARWRERMAPE